MQPEDEQLNRRGFLRLGGAGAIAAGTKAISPSQLFAEEKPAQLTDRTAPVSPVRLRSSEMKVVLGRCGAFDRQTYSGRFPCRWKSDRSSAGPTTNYGLSQQRCSAPDIANGSTVGA